MLNGTETLKLWTLVPLFRGPMPMQGPLLSSSLFALRDFRKYEPCSYFWPFVAIDCVYKNSVVVALSVLWRAVSRAWCTRTSSKGSRHNRYNLLTRPRGWHVSRFFIFRATFVAEKLIVCNENVCISIVVSHLIRV